MTQTYASSGFTLRGRSLVEMCTAMSGESTVTSVGSTWPGIGWRVGR